MTCKNICFHSLTVMVLGAVLGCGDDSGLPRRYPVSGQVNYNGKPLEFGTINFVPAAPDGRAATGTIADGHYSLTTHEPGDGALPGSYKVSVLARKTDVSKVPVPKVNRPGGGPLTEAQKEAIALHFEHEIKAKAAAAAKNLIPVRYSSPETSELTFDVQERSNTANFELQD